MKTNETIDGVCSADVYFPLHKKYILNPFVDHLSKASMEMFAILSSEVATAATNTRDAQVIFSIFENYFALVTALSGPIIIFRAPDPVSNVPITLDSPHNKRRLRRPRIYCAFSCKKWERRREEHNNHQHEIWVRITWMLSDAPRFVSSPHVNKTFNNKWISYYLVFIHSFWHSDSIYVLVAFVVDAAVMLLNNRFHCNSESLLVYIPISSRSYANKWFLPIADIWVR